MNKGLERLFKASKDNIFLLSLQIQLGITHIKLFGRQPLGQGIMKKENIVKIIAQEFKTSNVDELNKVLKSKDAPAVKFRISGKKIGHLGFTGVIKNIAAEGVKVFDVNKVSLIKYADIEKIEKAKPKVARHVGPKKVVESKKIAETKKVQMIEDVAPSYPEETKPEKFRKKAPGKQGSSFIPKSRK